LCPVIGKNRDKIIFQDLQEERQENKRMVGNWGECRVISLWVII
jgi:hypothetical protein